MSELWAPPVDGSGIAAVAPGFTDPVFDAQVCFRTLLDAMAHPGRIIVLPVAFDGEPPKPLGVAAAQIALTLCDVDTPVWLDVSSSDAVRYLAFHCGATVIDTQAEARFAFSVDPDRLPPLDQFALGSDEYPDRSSTLVIQVAGFEAGSELTLRGPGIGNEAHLRITGLPARFWDERRALEVLYPRGLDIFFVSGASVVALPRSTRVL